MISIADKKFRGRDKIVQKMTKDGLVDENLRTGEQKSATAAEKPEQEDSAKETAEKEADEELCMDAEGGEEETPRHHSTAKQSADYYKAHQEDGKPKDAPAESDAEPPTKKGRLSLKMKKAALSVAWGWALRRWRRKEWTPPPDSPIRKYIRWKKTIPAWKLLTSRKKPPNACTTLSKAEKSPKINLPERRKEVARIRNPAA